MLGERLISKSGDDSRQRRERVIDGQAKVAGPTRRSSVPSFESNRFHIFDGHSVTQKVRHGHASNRCLTIPFVPIQLDLLFCNFIRKRNIFKFWVGILILLLSNSDSMGQHGVSLVYAPSKVIKHRTNLLFDVPDRSHEFRLAYTYQTTGKYSWERYWNKPRITINAFYVNYGNKILGNAYAVLPELHFKLARWKALTLNFQFGTGIAYLNKPYNALTNPMNNAIGSNLNNISSLKFGLAYQWNDQWITTLSTGIVHFSNGLSSSPNSGINMYGLSFGGVYSFGKKGQKEETINVRNEANEEEVKSFKRWVVDLQYQYGFTEHSVPDGPKYGVYSFSLGGGYRYSEFLTVSIGGEYEFNDGRYTFFRRNFYTEQQSLDLARSTILYLEHELRFGQIFNRLRLGFYLPYPIENSRSMYTKLVTGIYLPEIKGIATPYVGVMLKTHSEIADYLGILFGVRI